MTKYREILRLTSLGLSQRDIMKSLGIVQKTVVKVQRRAKKLALTWPLDNTYTDAKLERIMFPKDPSPPTTRTDDFQLSGLALSAQRNNHSEFFKTMP